MASTWSRRLATLCGIRTSCRLRQRCVLLRYSPPQRSFSSILDVLSESSPKRTSCIDSLRSHLQRGDKQAAQQDLSSVLRRDAAVLSFLEGFELLELVREHGLGIPSAFIVFRLCSPPKKDSDAM